MVSVSAWERQTVIDSDKNKVSVFIYHVLGKVMFCHIQLKRFQMCAFKSIHCCNKEYNEYCNTWCPTVSYIRRNPWIFCHSFHTTVFLFCEVDWPIQWVAEISYLQSTLSESVRKLQRIPTIFYTAVSVLISVSPAWFIFEMSKRIVFRVSYVSASLRRIFLYAASTQRSLLWKHTVFPVR
jgi:hypothetical protein